MAANDSSRYTKYIFMLSNLFVSINIVNRFIIQIRAGKYNGIQELTSDVKDLTKTKAVRAKF